MGICNWSIKCLVSPDWKTCTREWQWTWNYLYSNRCQTKSCPHGWLKISRDPQESLQSTQMHGRYAYVLLEKSTVGKKIQTVKYGRCFGNVTFAWKLAWSQSFAICGRRKSHYALKTRFCAWWRLWKPEQPLDEASTVSLTRISKKEYVNGSQLQLKSTNVCHIWATSTWIKTP